MSYLSARVHTLPCAVGSTGVTFLRKMCRKLIFLMTNELESARCQSIQHRKTARTHNARFASAITCSFGIKPRSSLRLAFWRDSPEPSHKDFSSLSDPPALTAPHHVLEKHVLVAM